jgi:alkaline phosphatase D
MSNGSNVGWSRRDFIRASLDATAAIALGSIPAFGNERDVRFRANPFGLGVASGDPHSDGVVLWARLDERVLDQAGALRSPVPVRWEVSEDERFRRIVQTGSQIAQPDLGHSVHAEIEGLRPGRHYWYRFMAGGELSPSGRTKTAPADTASPSGFQFAFASCQNYQQGYYTAYRRLAEEDLDLVVHLGDYIYEEPSTGATRVRQIPVSGEVITLDEYRTRYSIYRSDPDLQAAHAAFPWVVTPDDHDVSDDYAGPFSDHDMPSDQFLVRRAAAYQAYYEFMPLRRSSMPSGPNMKIFRRVSFGDLAAFHVLDTRQYRTKQPCGAIGRPPRCSEALSPTQHILGPHQERWLMHGLSASRSRWNILANQVMITEMALMRNDAPTFSVDKWDGYIVERTSLLRFLAEAQPFNPIFITGDFHSNLVGGSEGEFRRSVVADDRHGVRRNVDLLRRRRRRFHAGRTGGAIAESAAEVLQRQPRLRALHDDAIDADERLQNSAVRQPARRPGRNQGVVRRRKWKGWCAAGVEMVQGSMVQGSGFGSKVQGSRPDSAFKARFGSRPWNPEP